MAATTIQIWIGSEAQRLVSTAVPNLRDIVITDERNIYVGDGVSPLLALIRSFDPPGTAAALFATANSAIQAVASRPTAPPRQTSYSIRGGWALGYASNGPIVNLGYDVGGVRARIDEPPQGQPAVLQLIDGATATVLYTMTIPVGQTLVDDLAASFHLNDGAQLRVNFTAIGSTFPGRGLQLELVASATGTTGGGIGAASNLQPSAVGASSLVLSWDYSGGDPPDHYEIRFKTGANPPTSLSDGTAAPDAPGAATSQQIAGLASAGFYSFAVTPVASDGTPGAAATLSNIQMGALDTTPPGQVTNTSYVAGSAVITPSWTNPTDPDFHHVVARIKLNTTVPFAALTAGQSAPTEGHPAAVSSVTGTGAGTALPAGAATFVQSGLSASTSYVIGLWTVDASGNINPTPVSIVAATIAAPTTSGGRGDNAVILSTYDTIGGPLTFTGSNPLAVFVNAGKTVAGDEGYGNAVQGPSARANVDVITDPILGGTNKVMRMQMARLTNGWLDSTSATFQAHPKWVVDQNGNPVTNGTGWYGSRVGANWPSQSSGALEATWWIANNDGSTATALGNNSKGLTFMWFPDTGWPRDELDIVELFSATDLQANMHFLNSTGGDGQVHALAGTGGFNIFAPITTTCMWEPGPAGTGGKNGGVGRIRIFHKQAGVAGDTGVGTPKTWFDTNKPYVGRGVGSNPPTDDAIERLLTQSNPGGLGMAVAYVPGSVTHTGSGDATVVTGGAAFGCGTGGAANQRTGHAALLRRISWWKAA